MRSLRLFAERVMPAFQAVEWSVSVVGAYAQTRRVLQGRLAGKGRGRTRGITRVWFRHPLLQSLRSTSLNLPRDPHIAVGIDAPPGVSHEVVIAGTTTGNDQDLRDEACRIIALEGGGRGGRRCGTLAPSAARASHRDTGAQHHTGAAGSVRAARG